jgi:thioredoxin-like negative regulator of GroEL
MLLEPKKSSKNKIFEETSYQAIQAAHRKKWTFIGVFLLVITIITALIAKDYFSSRSQNKIANEYARIDLIYQKETAAFQEKTKTASVAKNSEADYSQSMPLFYKFALEHKDNPYGWQAAIRTATYFIAKDKNKEAEEVLTAISPNIQKFPLVQTKVGMTLASVYAAQKNNAKAIEELSKVENLAENPMPNQARLLKAQILFVSGNKKEANKILNQIISSPVPADSKPGSEDQTKKQAQLWLSYIGN